MIKRVDADLNDISIPTPQEIMENKEQYTYNYRRPVTKKNQKREQKINQKVSQLTSKALKLYEQYFAGEDVETVQDTLGNWYIPIVIGDSRYFEHDHNPMTRGRERHHPDNSKTREIFSRLYTELKKHGIVVCQKDNERTWKTEAWILVKQADEKETN